MKEPEWKEEKPSENSGWEKTSVKPLRDIFNGLVKQVWKKYKIVFELHSFKHRIFSFHLKDHGCELEPCKSFQESLELLKLWYSTGLKYLEYFGLPV